MPRKKSVKVPPRVARRVARAELACRRRATTQRARTFRNSDQGLAALLAANPDLAMLLESDCSQACRYYRGWRKGGRRGPKVPLRGPGEGRFDAIDVSQDRKGKRRVTSWLEAAYSGVPPSRRWQDFDTRVRPLEEAAGVRLALPDEVYRLADDEESFARCHEQAERDLSEARGLRPRIRKTKRRRRQRQREVDNDVPF